jgi:hypothetical protein
VLLPPRRHELGDNAIAIGDDNRLAGRGQPDVFAEFVLQDFEADGARRFQVASGSYFVNPPPRTIYASQWAAPCYAEAKEKGPIMKFIE